MTDPLFRRVSRIDFAEAPLAAGSPPPAVPTQTPITNSAFASVEKRALLVGGYSPVACESTNQVLEYDMVAKQWNNLTTTTPFPQERISEAQMVAIGSTYYLFGGYNDETLLDGFWSLTTQNGEAKGCAWEQVKQANNGPSPRRGHSMVVVNGGEPENAKIYIYGGFDGESRLGDMWSFDLATSTWRNIDYTSSIAPPPRDAAMVAVDIQNNRIVVFGGYTSCRADDLYFFDLSEEKWSKYPTQGGPSPRYGSFAAVNGNYFVVGLGIDVKGPSGLACQLNLTEMKWTVASFEGDEIEGRAYSSYAVVDGGKRVFAFGGTNNKKYSASMYEFELEKTDAVANPKGKK